MRKEEATGGFGNTSDIARLKEFLLTKYGVHKSSIPNDQSVVDWTIGRLTSLAIEMKENKRIRMAFYGKEDGDKLEEQLKETNRRISRLRQELNLGDD